LEHLKPHGLLLVPLKYEGYLVKSRDSKWPDYSTIGRRPPP
jgi:hypothetical protein